MARKGRPPKPTNLKILHGNPGKRPLPVNEPKPKPIPPKCPAWMDSEGKKLWKNLMPELERLGLMTIVDGAAFEAVCQNYATWVKCEKHLKKHGLTFTIGREVEIDDEGNERVIKEGYVQQRPEVTIGNKALKAVHTFMVEFGLTPAARVKLGTKPATENEDPMEALLRGVGV